MSKMINLSLFLKRALRSKGLSVPRAAEALGIPYNSLRSWLSANRFPKRELSRIAQFLDLSDSQEELAKRYRFELIREKEELRYEAEDLKGGGEHTPQEVWAFFKKRMDRVGRFYRDFGGDVRTAVGTMATNHIIVYWSLDEIPLEMSWDEGWAEIVDALAAAVNRGARFVYLHPHQDLIDRMCKVGLSRLITEAEWRRKWQSFKNRMIERGCKAEQFDPTKGPVTEVALHEAAFTTPGERYVLFYAKDMAEVVGRFPTSSERNDINLLALVTEPVRDNFVSFVQQVLHDENAVDALRM